MANPFVAVHRALRSLFGSLHWSPPPWLADFRRRRKERPLRFWGGVLLLLIVCTALGAALVVRHRPPDPRSLVAVVETPGPTVDDPRARPEALRIYFVTAADAGENGQAFPDALTSAARLDLMGKVLESGVRLDPQLPGNWRWEDDQTLVFAPEAEWPPGTRFQVRLDRALFAEDARLASRRVSFETPPMTALLETLEFYRNPVDRQIRQAVATLRFSHPVDEDSLQRHLSLTLLPADEAPAEALEPVAFDVEYAETRRTAYVRSAPLAWPEQSRYLSLALAAGVRSSVGGAPSSEGLKAPLLIPDRGSFFQVREVLAHILRDPEDRPRQMLTLRFNDEVAERELAARLQVWLLPEENPRRGDRRWTGPREVTDEVLEGATLLSASLVETEHGFARELHLPLDLPPDRFVYLRIAAGLTSQSGFVHESFYDALVRVPSYPQELRLAAEGAILPLSGSRRLGLVSRGLEACQVRVGRVLPDQLHHLLSQSRGDLTDLQFDHYRFDQDNLVVTSEQVVPLNSRHPGEANYASIDLGAYLPSGQNRFGLFFVEINGWDRERNGPMGWISDRRLVLITDLGLLVKENADQSRELFVQSLSRGVPVSGAEVTLLGRNGLPLLRRSTGAEGHVSFPDVHSFQREQEPTVYVVKTATDTSFIPFRRPARQLNLSRFDVGGVHLQAGDSRQLSAFVFSDRGIYRPGETVQLAGIVKAAPLGNIEGIPLELVVRGPRGNELSSQRLILPSRGFFEQAFATRAAAETGSYQASLFLVRDDNRRETLIGSTDFRVEEFQPDSLRIQSVLVGVDKLAWSNADRLTARVRLHNLFGTAAQGRRVTAVLNLRSARFRFDEYADYSFADPWYDPDRPPLEVRESLPPATTDARGEAEFVLPLDRYAAGTYLLTMISEGFEPGGGRSVSARNSLLISPLDRLVGTRSDGPLDYIHQDAERFIELIAIDPTLKTQSLENLQTRLSELRSLSTLVLQPNGSYAYQSVERQQELTREAFAIAADGSRFRLPTERPGTYLWEVVDAEGLTLARQRFTVVGHGNLLGTLEKSAELQLQLDRRDYKAGERIEMNLVAPYAGSGLITIESDRVHAWKWFRNDANSTLQTIDIPDDLEGNAYVNVTFVRDAGSREIFTSPLSYAVAPFSIDRSRRTLALDLQAPSRVRPGETLEIGYSTAGPARILVFAVDEGILQVADYRSPRPLDHFLRKRALQVGTLQMLDLVLPEFALIRELSAQGGDMAEEGAAEALAASLNPFARTLDEPALFWSGIIDSDGEDGSVAFTVPESFSGRLRIMAVAVAEEALGAAQKSSVVRGPFVITPSLPLHAAPDDRFRVTAGISNLVEGGGAEMPLKVALEVSDALEIIGPAEQSLTLDEGSETTVHFELRARDRIGPAEVRFTVSSDTDQAVRRAGMSLRPARPYATTFDSGYADRGRVDLALSRDLYDELSRRQAAAAFSPLVLVAGLGAFLEDFPHGCTEQRVSRVFPYIGAGEASGFALSADALRQSVAELVAALRTRQLADGSFSAWPGGRQTAEFPSLYTLHFLLEASEQGHAVPEEMLRRGRSYLRHYVTRSRDDVEGARLRAYAIYLLTRMGEVTSNHLASLQAGLEESRPRVWRQDLAAAYMAGAYALLQRSAEAERLIGNYRPVREDGLGEGTFHAPLARDAQYVYLLSRHFPQRAAALDGKELLTYVEPVFRGRYHTLSAAYTLLALGAYAEQAEAPLRDRQLTFTAVDSEGREQTQAVAAWPAPRADLAANTARVRIAGDEAFYYVLTQAGFDRTMPTRAVRQGLEIDREYLDEDNQPLSELQQGQEVTVRLRLRALGEAVADVAVVDLLPGGFEVLRDSVPRTASGWQAEYVDVREDRVVFYGHFGTSVRELRYRVRATAAGEFVIPPPYAEALYDRAVRAEGVAGSLTVSPAP